MAGLPIYIYCPDCGRVIPITDSGKHKCSIGPPGSNRIYVFSSSLFAGDLNRFQPTCIADTPISPKDETK